MKFLPRKYRESQYDCYGKKSISWHIAVAMTKREGKLEMLTFVHVFKSCTQDSYSVMAIIDDVIGQLKTGRPELDEVFLRQDNAACYHSAFYLQAMKEIAKKHRVQLRKNHVKAYVNSGNDVERAEQMQTAIESSNGVTGVRAVLCDPPSIRQVGTFKMGWRQLH